MPDFFLEPDEIEPERRRSVRLVATGLADTAEVPRSRTPEPSPCYAPCEGCGQAVLTGTTAAGARLALDTQHATSLVDWEQGAPAPRLVASRGYPVHGCHRREGAP